MKAINELRGSVSPNYDSMVELYHRMGEPKEFLEHFYDLDLPVPFFIGEEVLYVYPCLIDFSKYFGILIQCLLERKNFMGKVEFISMKYLDFLFWQYEHGEPQYLSFLGELLYYVFRIPCEPDGDSTPSIEMIKPDSGNAYITVYGRKIDSTKFDILKEIILNQNDVERDPDDIHPDVLKKLKETEEFRRKKSRFKMCGLADQISIVMLATGRSKVEVVSMTIRTFNNILGRNDIEIQYKLMTALSPYMEKTAQSNIIHYLADNTRDRYRELMTDYETVRKKIEG